MGQMTLDCILPGERCYIVKMKPKRPEGGPVKHYIKGARVDEMVMYLDDDRLVWDYTVTDEIGAIQNCRAGPFDTYDEAVKAMVELDLKACDEWADEMAEAASIND